MAPAQMSMGSSGREGLDLPESGGHEGHGDTCGTHPDTRGAREDQALAGMMDPNRRLEDTPDGKAKAVAPMGHASGCC